MTRRSNRRTWNSILIRLGLFLSVCIGMLGCQNVLWRGQNADSGVTKTAETPAGDKTKYIGGATAVWGMKPFPVESIALVTQLDHTGSDPPQSGQRDQLVKDMQAHHVQNAAEILASDTTSMVIVGGNLPPGIRKGERFDVYVTTLPNSETTSLRGGFVMQSQMSPKAVVNERKVLSGHEAALVKGRVLVRALFEPGDDPMLENSGYILGGGVAMRDQPLSLAIRDEFATLKTAVTIGRAINARFTTYDETGKIGVAKPKNDRAIELLVPEEYRQNIGRYVRLIVNMAYQESSSDRLDRMQQLERELNEPALAQTAALRLEAIGRDAVPALKRALQNDDAEVRFFAAEALTYMDEADGIAELRQAAEQMPNFRWHALTALSSSEELAAGTALLDLMQSDNSETRYGAFRAMLARSPQDPMMVGEWMPGEYFLHFVPSSQATMIHFSMQNRAEIVVFGGNVPVDESFIYVENGLTVQAKPGDIVEMTRYLPGKGENKVKCKNTVSEVIRAMAQLGCDYETMLAMCKDAQKSDTLNCKMVINRVPKPERLYMRDGASAEEFAAMTDGKTGPPTDEQPESFATDALETDGEETPNDYPTKTETKPPAKGIFATMKGWFTTK